MNPNDAKLIHEAHWRQITQKPGSSFAYLHIRAERFPFPFHYHAEMELTYIVKGRGTRVVGDVVESYSDGDLALLGSNLPHVWMSDLNSTGTEAYVLHFDQATLEKSLLPLPESTTTRQWLRRADKGLKWTQPLPDDLITRMAKLAPDQPPGKRLLALLDLLFTLSEASAWRAICDGKRPALPLHSTEQRIGFALRLMRERFCSELPQSEVARQLGMTTSAFSHLFHRTTGKAYREHLRELRIGHAQRLLAATQLPVTEICFASGYNNLSNFNKQFLALVGSSPLAFRKASQPN